MKAFLINFSLVVASVLVALGLVEFGLRLSGFSSPTFLQVDPVTGYKHRPNAEGLYTDEGRAYVRINSAGLRDMEHSLARPPDTIRVAVLGDSYAAALQVPLEATFWKRLESHLSHCDRAAGKNVEVINFGVIGYGTVQELLALRDRVWPYQPDIVLLALFTGNDIRDNSKALSGAYAKPYIDRQMQVDTGFTQTNAYRLMDSAPYRLLVAASDHSRILQLLNVARIRMTQPRASGAGREGELGLNDRIYLPPADEVWRDAWDITEALVLQINKEVTANGARFFVATLSNGIQVHPDAQTREAYRKRLGVEDLFYPDRRIAQLLKDHEIAHAIIAPELARLAAADNSFMHGFANNGLGEGHWNETGHRHAAAIIAPRLCEVLTPTNH